MEGTCVVAPLSELALVVVEKLFHVEVDRRPVTLDRLNNADLDEENRLSGVRFNLETIFLFFICFLKDGCAAIFELKFQNLIPKSNFKILFSNLLIKPPK